MGDKEKDGKGAGTEWMYNQSQGVDQEDYLLGKKIGQNFENEGTMGQLNAVEYDCAPPSIFASKAGHQVDLQRKLMEDPLVAIKKRELEDRKRLLDNPMKMKALREHIDSLKKAKKEKKKKKKKKNRGSDSEDDTDLDLKLLQRLEKIEGREAEQDRRRIQEEEEKERQAIPKAPVYTDREELDSPPREDRRIRNKPRNDQDLKIDNRKRHRSGSREGANRRRRDSPPPSSRRRRQSSSPPSPPPSYRRRSRSRDKDRRPSPPSSYRRRSRSRDARRASPPPSQRHRSRSRERRSSPPPPQRHQNRSRSRERKRYESPDAAPPRQRSRSADEVRPDKKLRKGDTKNAADGGKKQRTGDKKSVDVVDKEAEKARKLAEMMDNATWREEQRANKVKSYRKQEEKESTLTEHDPEFLRRELRKAAASSSVESRIKANKHSIQRGVGVMDSNFARR